MCWLVGGDGGGGGRGVEGLRSAAPQTFHQLGVLLLPPSSSILPNTLLLKIVCHLIPFLSFSLSLSVQKTRLITTLVFLWHSRFFCVARVATFLALHQLFCFFFVSEKSSIWRINRNRSQHPSGTQS